MFPLAGQCCAAGLKAAGGEGWGGRFQPCWCVTVLPARRVEADRAPVPGEKEEIHTCSWPGPGCLLTQASEKSSWLGLGACSFACTQVLAPSAATKKS